MMFLMKKKILIQVKLEHAIFKFIGNLSVEVNYKKKIKNRYHFRDL